MRKEASGKFRSAFKAGLNLFSLFQIHLENWFKIQFICAHKLHISPIDLRQLEFYEVEYLLKNFEEYIDEEEKAYKKQESKQTKQYQQSQPKMDTPKMNYGGFKTPKIDIPKINIPRI